VASGAEEVLATRAIGHSCGKGSAEFGSCVTDSNSCGVDFAAGAGDTIARGIFMGIVVDIGVTMA
jgi:hypothetical protein